MVMNMTSASLSGEIPPIPKNCILPDTLCYDVEYAKGDTAFCAFAKSLGAKQVVDGFGMTIEHNAVLFELWRGVKPDSRQVFERLKKSLS